MALLLIWLIWSRYPSALIAIPIFYAVVLALLRIRTRMHDLQPRSRHSLYPHAHIYGDDGEALDDLELDDNPLPLDQLLREPERVHARKRDTKASPRDHV